LASGLTEPFTSRFDAEVFREAFPESRHLVTMGREGHEAFRKGIGG
jgi:hypothetical protein